MLCCDGVLQSVVPGGATLTCLCVDCCSMIEENTSVAILVKMDLVTDRVAIEAMLRRYEGGVPSLFQHGSTNGALIDPAAIAQLGYIRRCLCGDFVQGGFYLHVCAWMKRHNLFTPGKSMDARDINSCNTAMQRYGRSCNLNVICHACECFHTSGIASTHNICSSTTL